VHIWPGARLTGKHAQCYSTLISSISTVQSLTQARSTAELIMGLVEGNGTLLPARTNVTWGLTASNLVVVVAVTVVTEAVDPIQVRTGSCALDIELSHRKSSFTHKLSRSANPVINGLSVLKLWAVLCVFPLFFSDFVALFYCIVSLSSPFAAVMANKDIPGAAK